MKRKKIETQLQKYKRVNFKKDCLFFGLDMLELYILDTLIFDDFGQPVSFKGLDFDNTRESYCTIRGVKFTLKQIKPKGFRKGIEFSTAVDGRSHSIFSINFGRSENDKQYVLVLYSTFFVLESYFVSQYGFSILDFVKHLNLGVTTVRRFDIAFDLPYKVNFIMKKIFSKVPFSSAVGGIEKSGFYETYYYGDVRSDKNRNYIFRVYDKIKDSFKKNKSFLYPHLQDNDDVRRIELEMRPLACSKLRRNYVDILTNKNDIIQSLFALEFNKISSVEFPANDVSLKPYTYNPYDLSLYFSKFGFIPIKYLQRSRGYITKILECTGFEGLIQILLNVQIDESAKGINIVSMNIHEILTFLEKTIDYVIKIGISKTIIKKVLIKSIKRLDTNYSNSCVKR